MTQDDSLLDPRWTPTKLSFQKTKMRTSLTVTRRVESGVGLLHGEEGVGGSSPPERFKKFLLMRMFLFAGAMTSRRVTRRLGPDSSPAPCLICDAVVDSSGPLDSGQQGGEFQPTGVRLLEGEQ